MSYNNNLYYNNVSGVVTFEHNGIYEITISFPEYVPSTQADDWTAFRLFGIGAGEAVGISNSLILGPAVEWSDYSTSFLAQIDDANELYQIQLGRSSQDLTMNETPGDIDGTTAPQMLCIIKYLGPIN